ncbi:hypothetical protein BSK59_13845 [Paenibacillus odorifer]|uniref:hypothetical protein n=1 Tax=Paenibacillus odorifer TaxID=189426 RepID=UPI000970053E|nr:hypothetical protein [Paenibacillus odorifer]OME55553.1 hypothetical protein BSK59_13845 [Paenibacillus odorifer]
MNQEILDKVLAYIDALSVKFGVASKYLLDMMIKQEIIQGVLGLVGMTVLYIVTAFVFIKFIPKSFKWMLNDIEKSKKEKRFPNDWSDYPHIIIPVVLAVIVLAVAVSVCTFTLLPTSINRLVNPEYFVLKEILAAFK